jgi:DNA-binding LytR/AlgR family response regulator
LQTHRSTVVNKRFIQAVHRKDEAVELEMKGIKERLKVSNANHRLFRAM